VAIERGLIPRRAIGFDGLNVLQVGSALGPSVVDSGVDASFTSAATAGLADDDDAIPTSGLPLGVIREQFSTIGGEGTAGDHEMQASARRVSRIRRRLKGAEEAFRKVNDELDLLMASISVQGVDTPMRRLFLKRLLEELERLKYEQARARRRMDRLRRAAEKRERRRNEYRGRRRTE
jgi:hypothetical protein